MLQLEAAKIAAPVDVQVGQSQITATNDGIAQSQQAVELERKRRLQIQWKLRGKLPRGNVKAWKKIGYASRAKADCSTTAVTTHLMHKSN